jgi:hypothetical protein
MTGQSEDKCQVPRRLAKQTNDFVTLLVRGPERIIQDKGR